MSVMADPGVLTRFSSYPGVEFRLLGDVVGTESLEQYLEVGGYRSVTDPAALHQKVSDSRLRGRGGGAFPMAVKIETVKSGEARPVVVANGEEGEPASVKDRWLMRNRPHLVLDGLRLAAELVDTEDVFVYVSDTDSARAIRHASEEAEAQGVWAASVCVVTVEPTYVAGEETALVQALNGGPALPMDKPPRPFEEGVHGRPTLVCNVESLCSLALLHRMGAAGYAAVGVQSCPGTFLLTLTGSETASGLYEVPYGITLRHLLAWLGENVDDVVGCLMGGYFAGVLGPSSLDLKLDYDSVRSVGSGLGCGAVGLIRADDCPVRISAAVMAYFARENAQQCGSCFNGTAAMSAVLTGLVEGRATQSDLDRLVYWSTSLRGRGACGTLDGATNIATSLLREFGDLTTNHLQHGCTNCGNQKGLAEVPFAVALPRAV